MGEIAITCLELTKVYSLYRNGWQRLSNLIFPDNGKSGSPPHQSEQKRHYVGAVESHDDSEEITRHDKYHLYALDHVNLFVRKGEILGVIGLNGSGKSTLARIFAGITTPTSGIALCHGQVNMLSISTGLNLYMTGIENIQYKCRLMGLSKAQSSSLLPKIADFSDLGVYLEQPLRTYSSGMRARLGFSIAINILPDILVVDEALSVGDMGFAGKCAEKMRELQNEQRTILYISHAVGGMQNFCDRVVWLHNGRVVAVDKPEKLILPYCAFAREYAEMTNSEKRETWPDLKTYQRKLRII